MLRVRWGVVAWSAFLYAEVHGWGCCTGVDVKGTGCCCVALNYLFYELGLFCFVFLLFTKSVYIFITDTNIVF